VKTWLGKFLLTPLTLYFVLLGIEYYMAMGLPARLMEIRRLRDEGQSAHPAFTAQHFLGERADLRFIPLGGIANTKTVLCQEDGPIVSYLADRHGFRNHDRIWNEDEWDLAILGDSYVQGYCEPDGGTFVDRVREVYKKTANLGSYGNGPLANLATLLEYAVIHRPKKVLWVYVPNDLRIDLPMERENLTLTDYLVGKTQNLPRRQSQIDTLLREESERIMSRARPFSIGAWLSLKSLNELMARTSLRHRRGEPALDGFPPDYLSIESNDYGFFEAVLAQAQGAVSSWGGELVLVTIRDSGSFTPSLQEQVKEHWRRLGEVADHVGVPMLELRPEDGNPFNEFNVVSSYYGHVNSSGHADLARQILRALDKPLTDKRARRRHRSRSPS
jgi:hypothetical protein